MPPSRRRPLAFGLIVGGHVLVAYVLEHSVLTSISTRQPDGLAPMSGALLEDRPQPTTERAQGRRRATMMFFPPKAPKINLPEVPHLQFDAESPNSDSIDWRSEAHAAATDIYDREQQKSRVRSFTHTPAAPNAPGDSGVFGLEEQNHRAGRVEGGTRFWVTDNCYLDFPRGSPPPRMAGEFHLLTPTCKPPPTGGGDKLFENLKPDSLKVLPKPAN
jgi:hypothetical protein